MSDDLLKDLIGLPEAAQILGLHRGTLNAFVLEARLKGYRLGPHWYVRKSEVELFSTRYQRPKNRPRHHNSQSQAAYWTEHILRWLALWESATANELDRVIDIHVGNLRKYLAFAQQEGLVDRDQDGYWSLTETGRSRAARLPPAGEVSS